MHRSLYRLRFPCFSKRDMKAFSTSSRNGSFPTALLIPKNIRKHTTAAVLYLFSIYLQEAPVIFPYATTKAKKNQIKLQNNNVDNNKNNIWSSFGSHSIKLVLKRRKRQDNPCSKAVPIFLRPKHCFKSNSTEPTDKTIIKTTTTIKTTTPDILTIIPETTVTTRRTTSTSSTTPRATSKNTTHKRKTTIPPKKHLAMMNTTTSNTKSSSVSFNIPIQQTAATMISSESFTPATTEDVIQNMKLQNQDSSSSYFAEPLNIVFISTVVALTTITSTVGIIYYMHSKVTGARRKR